MIFGPSLPLFLLLCGLLFSIKLGKINVIFKPLTVIKSLFGYERSDKGISPFKAVTLALAGTLGVGNIAGVATAVTAGGPGAVFWMIVSAFISLIIKYSEIVLAMLFKEKKNCISYGGAIYYIKKGIGSKVLSVIFAIICIFASFSLGNIVQVKSAADAVSNCFALDNILCGAILCILTFVVISGGVKSISDVTVRLIPFLSVTYLAISLYIIFTNFSDVALVLKNIVYDAFDMKSVSGGFIGFLTMKSIRFGVSRGIFSNEAGCGTAPFAHASAENKSPVEQGFWGIFEVFVDTILLCSVTAIVILLPYNEICTYDGMLLAIKAYEYYLGDFASYFMAVSVFLFAFASIICWSHYASECIKFISDKKILLKIYNIVYSLTAIYGSVASSALIWELADLSVSLMTFINMFAVLLLFDKVKQSTDEYFKNKKPN